MNVTPLDVPPNPNLSRSAAHRELNRERFDQSLAAQALSPTPKPARTKPEEQAAGPHQSRRLGSRATDQDKAPDPHKTARESDLSPRETSDTQPRSEKPETGEEMLSEEDNSGEEQDSATDEKSATNAPGDPKQVMGCAISITAQVPEQALCNEFTALNSQGGESLEAVGGKPGNSGDKPASGSAAGSGIPGQVQEGGQAFHAPAATVHGQSAAAPLETGSTPSALPMTPAPALAGPLNANALEAGPGPNASAPAPSAGLPTGTDSEATLARVARGLRNAMQQNGGVVTLRLNPPELGLVRIQMEISHGAANVEFQSQHEGVRHLLAQRMEGLREALQAQGLQVGKLEVQPLASAGHDSRGVSDGASNEGRSRGRFEHPRESRSLRKNESGFGQTLINAVA